MKLTNRSIVEAYLGLQALGNYVLPVTTSFKAAKLKNQLRPLTEAFEEARMVLVRQCAVKDEKGKVKTNANKQVEIDSSQQELFDAEFKKLLAIESEVSFTDKIKIPEKTTSTCDQCHHNMDKPLIIELNILAALEQFIEID